MPVGGSGNRWGISPMIWNIMKWIRRPALVYSDPIFRLTTRILPGAILLLMCIHWLFRYFNDSQFSCYSTENKTMNGSDWKNVSEEFESANIESHCWNSGVFLVRKALDPQMRYQVTYPGISAYEKGEDAFIRQSYILDKWFTLAFCAGLAYMFNLIWKGKAVKRVNSVLNVMVAADSAWRDASEVRAALFRESVGFNWSFGRDYLFCKVLSSIVPVITLFALSGCIGPDFRLYGLNLLVFWLNGSESWPSPSDVVFPLMANCEYIKLTGDNDGDFRLASAQCRLPINVLTRLTFFALWWFLWIVAVSAFVHLGFMARYCFPYYRHNRYRAYLAVVCPDEVSAARIYWSPLTGLLEEHDLVDVIKVKLSFGDWLLLHLVKKNLSGVQFRNFIWQVANPDHHWSDYEFIAGFLIMTPGDMLEESRKLRRSHVSRAVTQTAAKAPNLYKIGQVGGMSSAILISDQTALHGISVHLASDSDWEIPSVTARGTQTAGNANGISSAPKSTVVINTETDAAPDWSRPQAPLYPALEELRLAPKADRKVAPWETPILTEGAYKQAFTTCWAKGHYSEEDWDDC